MASAYPFCPKLMRSKLNVVTIVTKPKSEGISSRAKTTVEINWTAKTTPWANTVAPAPRTARRRNPPSTLVSWNSPFASKGFKVFPDTQRVLTSMWFRTAVLWVFAWALPYRALIVSARRRRRALSRLSLSSEGRSEPGWCKPWRLPMLYKRAECNSINTLRDNLSLNSPRQ